MKNGIAWNEEACGISTTLDLLTMSVPDVEGKKKAKNMNGSPGEGGTRQAWRVAIALDGGTTNTRARLIQDGRVIATARREIGVRDTVLSGRSKDEILSAALRDVIQEIRSDSGRHAGAEGTPPRVEGIVASGMLTSEVGLVCIPHVVAPAGLADLSAAVATRTFRQVTPEPIHFVPGLRTPPASAEDGWTHADVMRGEECETFGALEGLAQRGHGVPPLEQGVAFVWPGSHTKLVEVDSSGRVLRSHTSLAGEILQAVGRHTLIAASLPASWPDRLDEAAADAGTRAVRDHGLQRAAFLVRIAALQETMTAEQRAAFWIGAVVADDVSQMVRHPILEGGRPVIVGGREPLRTWYARQLERSHRHPVMALDDELSDSASALGALAVASFRGASQPRTG